jgi:hypothetical protein
LVRRMAPAVKRAHDRTIDRLEQSDRGWLLLQLITLVEANNEAASVPLHLP